jgi:hypothetical protein
VGDFLSSRQPSAAEAAQGLKSVAPTTAATRLPIPVKAFIEFKFGGGQELPTGVGCFVGLAVIQIWTNHATDT